MLAVILISHSSVLLRHKDVWDAQPCTASVKWCASINSCAVHEKNHLS